MSIHSLTLRILSPTHIGDGDELRQDFDFVVYSGQTYRLNENAILLAKQDKLMLDNTGRYPPPGKLLLEADYNHPELFRYVLRGAPRSSKTDARVRSFIKDIHDHPYIPGSSLKGAFRTALAWTGWREVKPDINAIDRSKYRAGQPLERKLFGPDPNHDLLRTLHVSDLFGPQEPGGNLHLVNAQVLTMKSHGSPIEMEAVAGEVAFNGSLTIDEILFQQFAEKELHFANRKHWIDGLIARVQAHSQARIRDLLEWFERAEGTEKVASFYRRLAGVTLPQNQAFMQIGWGSGWDGKTFWTHLQLDPGRFEKIIYDFRLHKAVKGSPPRKIGDPFPRSKRAAMSVKAGVVHAAAPFGWCLVELV